MDHSALLDKSYREKLEKIDRSIELELSEIASCIKSLLPNNNVEKKRKEQRSVKEKKTQNEKELCPFIEKILQFFHSYPNDNFEELLLPHVGEIRQQNSLPLIDAKQLVPCKNCEFDESRDSIDNLEESTFESVTPNQAWEMLCWHIEKYIQKQLSIQTESFKYSPKMSRYTWQYYLQKLNNILSTPRLWEFHHHMRTYQLNVYKCPCFKSSRGWSNLHCLNCLVSLCVNNFLEDTKFITTGSFGHMVLTKDVIFFIYSRNISNLVYEIFQNIDAHNKSPQTTGLIRHMKCFFPGYCKKSDCSNIRRENTGSGNFTESVILQIIEILYIFEQRTLGVSNVVSQGYLNLNDLLMSLPNDSPEQSPVHRIGNQNVEQKETKTWNWRASIVENGFLNLLQRKLHNNISDSVVEDCSKEWKLFCETKNPGRIEIVVEEHNSYRVMGSAVRIVRLLDSYKPLLAASCGALFPFCASFCHVIHTYLVDLIDHVKRISENASMDCCYLSLYTCVFLIEKLSVYSNFCSCGNGNKSDNQLQNLIGTIENQLIEWIDYLKLRITTHHLKGILCGVLHDADSNNWEESKSFFENERISHCLSIWNIYMKRIISDFKQCLPSEIAYELYGKILSQSVNYLTARYSKVKPSESRTAQLKVDVTFLLLCVSEFLARTCNSLKEYLGLPDSFSNLGKSNQVAKEIHSNCCSLLFILAVVSSPLGALCKIYRNGFPQISNDTDKLGGKSNWLTWLHPILFPKSKDGTLISSTNVWLTIKISISQNYAVPLLVLQSSTLHNCTLSILLMTQASKLPKEQDNLKFDLACSVLTVLKFARHTPGYLGLVIVPVINSCNEWEIFDGYAIITSSNVKKPWWYLALIEIIRPLLKNSIGSSLTNLLRLATVLDSPSINEWKTMYLYLRQVVRCSCNETPVIDRETAIFLLSLNLLQCLVESVSSILPTILCCLIQLQDAINETGKEIKPIRNCVGLQVLLDITFHDLKNQDFLEECLGLKPTKPMKRMCHDVADCIISLITPNDKINNQSMPLWFVNQSKNSFDQIQAIFKTKVDQPNYATHDDFDDSDNMNQMLIDLLQEPTGALSLKYLHEIMTHNAAWIQKSLGVPFILSSDLVVNSVCPSPLPGSFKIKGEDSESLFIPEEESSKENYPGNDDSSADTDKNLKLDVFSEKNTVYTLFNAIEAFDKIGNQTFSFKSVSEVKYVWDALLSHLPVMGLTEEGFKGLLGNRWDINNEKILSEGEKRGVQVLKKQYSLEKQKPNVG